MDCPGCPGCIQADISKAEHDEILERVEQLTTLVGELDPGPCETDGGCRWSRACPQCKLHFAALAVTEPDAECVEG